MVLNRRTRWALALCFAIPAVALGEVSYEQAAPVLKTYCVGCHNADDFDGELSMETHAALMQGGENGSVIAPGNAGESEMIKLLTGGKPKMPPKKEPQPKAEEIALLTAWVNAGAPGPAGGKEAKFDVPSIAPKEGLIPAVTAAAYSPGGANLAVARFQTVELLDSQTLRPTQLLDDHLGKVNAIRFSSDGLRLAVATGVAGLSGSAVLWDVATGRVVRKFEGGHRDILYAAELSPDGKTLATAGYDRKVMLWNAETGEVRRTIKGHNGAVFDLAFSPNGKVIASAGADETVKLWSVATGERLDTLNQPQGEQVATTFSPSGEFVFCAGADNRIRMYRFVSRDKPQINPLVHARFAHEGGIVAMEVSPDGRWLVTAADDRTMAVWELPDLVRVRSFPEQADVVAGLAIDPTSKLVVATRMDGAVEAHALTPSFDRTAGGGKVALPTASSAGGEIAKVDEVEQGKAQPQSVDAPVAISGAIGEPGDADIFQFSSKAGEEWVIDVRAARDKSPLDSKISVLTASGDAIERVVLQAVRDSWFTFRGKNSTTADDFRVHNWEEMHPNNYLYANGEVVKLWHYPRGPDSGFMVYPGSGTRYTFFGTTAAAHALGQPIYVVRPFEPGTEVPPNGLPVFTVYYENDDDPLRRYGADSHLHFTAPADGDYLVEIGDVRGFGGSDHKYTLTIRPRRPDFKVHIDGAKPKVFAGGGKEFGLRVERIDGFQGAVTVDIEGLPAGFSVESPMVIEAGQIRTQGVLRATADAKKPAEAKMKITARALVRGKEVMREVGDLGEIIVEPKPKLSARIYPDVDGATEELKGLTLRPGETVTARVRIERHDHKARVSFGGADAGRGLSHGVYVDNIGLNGLMIVEGQSERVFFLTASDWVGESERWFHLKTGEGGGAATQAVRVTVVK